jgi:hypothetical protein
MKPMRGKKRESIGGYQTGQLGAEIQRSWNLFDPLPGPTLAKTERSQIRYTSPMNRVVSRPLKVCVTGVLPTWVLCVDPEYLAATTDNYPDVRHLRTAVYCHSRFSFVRKIRGLWNHYDNPLLCVFVDMHVADVRVLITYVFVGLKSKD